MSDTHDNELMMDAYDKVLMDQKGAEPVTPPKPPHPKSPLASNYKPVILKEEHQPKPIFTYEPRDPDNELVQRWLQPVINSMVVYAGHGELKRFAQELENLRYEIDEIVASLPDARQVDEG